jgi:hypothetical protein
MQAAVNERPTAEPDRLRSIARVYFAVVGAIGLLTGVVLLVAPGATADYFAWPIAPPQTAVFMGAGYLATGITLFILLFFGRLWADVRLFIPPIAVFAGLMIGATLLHADRFLWDRFVTWLWLGLYGVIVLGAIVLWVAHRTVRPSIPLPLGERVALIAVGMLIATWAVPLYVAPVATAAIWPWPLTPLTGRVVAGWVSVGAVLAVLAGTLNDTRGLRLPLVGWTITVLCFLVTSTLGVPFTSEPRVLVYFASLAMSIGGSLWLLARVQRRLSG